MSGENRLGRQTPTVSIRQPYTDSLGADAVEIYNTSGRTAQDWQAIMMEDIMAVNADGLWTHMKFGWSVPRRNGKSEILIMRAVWALLHGERVLYTAHRTTTSSNAWEKICVLLGKMGYAEEEDYKTYRTRGMERIEWLRDDSSALINFRTRTSTGGLGEGYDLLIIDEAQEYTADQESALKYVVTDSSNPQTLMCGTPPTAVSAGTVFLNYRRECLSGEAEDCGWAEWSVPELSDTSDVDLWYETNPSLGTILTERTVRNELGRDKVDDNIQRLGLWLRYSRRSAISKEDWEHCALTERPALPTPPRLFFAVKYGKTEHVSLAAAVKLPDGRVFVEAIDTRPIKEGNAWLLPFLLNPHAAGILIDGAGHQTILSDDMKNAGIKTRPVLPKVAEVITAHAQFEQAVFAGQLCHMGQPALCQAAENCEHRMIGSAGGFGYAACLEGVEISLLESVSFAHWLAANAKEKKQQKYFL
jgi:phage terminase large subunit-like protein